MEIADSLILQIIRETQIEKKESEDQQKNFLEKRSCSAFLLAY